MKTPFFSRLTSCLVIGLTSPGWALAADWPMFGRDKTRNAVSPEKNPPLWWQLGDQREQWKNIKWSAALGTRTKGDPVVAGGLVWVGTNNGAPRDAKFKDPAPVLMCFREKDGKFLYQYVTEGPPKDEFWESRRSGHTSSPLVEGDRIWFTTMWGETVCLDIGPLQNGQGPPRELWKVDMRRELGVLPAGITMGFAKTCSIGPSYKQFIYVITAKGVGDEERVASPKAPSLVCFHKETGKVQWTDNSPAKTLRDGEWASPLIVEIEGRGRVIAPQGDGWVRSFDALTGAVLWKFNTNPGDATWDWNGTANGLMATPVYDGRHVYIGNGRNPNDIGRVAWLYCLDPTKKGDISPEVMEAKGQGKPNPNSGMIWRYGGTDAKKKPVLRNMASSATVHGDLVIAVETTGFVHCLDAKTGRQHWRYDARANIIGSPLIVDGTVYVADSAGLVHLLALSPDLRVIRKIDMDENIWTSPVFANGVLYIAADNRLFAIAGKANALRDQANKLFGVINTVPAKKLTEPDVVLGRALFWDVRISGNAKTACASCHMPEDWGADRRKFSPDAKGKNTARNSQTVFNAVLQPTLRWTSDRKSGAHQAEKSLTGSMGLESADAVVPILNKLGYEALFKSAFPKDENPVSPANYAAAIQAYEETLITPAPFDRFLTGDDDALSAKQQDGLKLFISTGCASCHQGALLGGTSLRKFGVFENYWKATKSENKDEGLFETTKKKGDRYKFRVSMLRNIAKTGPYFHDGSVADLKEAVQVMADVQLGGRLGDADAAAIVSFLEALTGEAPKHYAPPKKGAGK